MTRRPAKITPFIELRPQTIGLICPFQARTARIRRQVAGTLRRGTRTPRDPAGKKLPTSFPTGVPALARREMQPLGVRGDTETPDAVRYEELYRDIVVTEHSGNLE